MAKAVQAKKHRAWADLATLEAIGRGYAALDVFEPIPVRITVHSNPTGPHADRDGVVGAAKAYLDGIADRLKLNDQLFAAPTVEFAAPRKGRFVIEVGAL